MGNKSHLTVSEVSEKYGVAESAVRAAIKSGRIRAFKLGWIWVFRKEDLPDIWPGRKVG